MSNQFFFCPSTKRWFIGLDVMSIKQVFLKEIFDHLLLAEIDQHTVDMPAETLTQSRATNGKGNMRWREESEKLIITFVKLRLKFSRK